MISFVPGSPWQKLNAWLFHPKETVFEFLIFRAALSLFLNHLYFLIVYLIEQDYGLFVAQKNQLVTTGKRLIDWSSVVLTAPFLESLMIVLLLKLGSWLRLQVWANCVLCAFLMALLHVPGWGWLKPLPTFVSFAIYTSAYLAYYQRSRLLAFALCMGLHVLNNGFIYI